MQALSEAYCESRSSGIDAGIVLVGPAQYCPLTRCIEKLCTLIASPPQHSRGRTAAVRSTGSAHDRGKESEPNRGRNPPKEATHGTDERM